MNIKIGTLSSIAALLLSSGIANAQGLALPGTIEVPSGNDGYVNSGGNAVRTGLGECLKQNSFNEEVQVDACEGIEEEPEPVVEPEPEPEPEPAPAPAPVEKEPIITTATLGGEALFETNSSDLSAASEQALAELVIELQDFQEITSIEVSGHTDSLGEESYNQGLSEERAAAVETFLAAAFPNVPVSSIGLGESSPVATNSTRDGRALNRRVEVQVTAKSITEQEG